MLPSCQKVPCKSSVRFNIILGTTTSWSKRTSERVPVRNSQVFAQGYTTDGTYYRDADEHHSTNLEYRHFVAYARNGDNWAHRIMNVAEHVPP